MNFIRSWIKDIVFEVLNGSPFDHSNEERFCLKRQGGEDEYWVMKTKSDYIIIDGPDGRVFVPKATLYMLGFNLEKSDE